MRWEVQLPVRPNILMSPLHLKLKDAEGEDPPVRKVGLGSLYI